MHLHILGICGTFMGGIAALARESGHRVTGCDANVYPPMSDQLRALGIDLVEGWDPSQLEDPAIRGADCFVVGNVVTRGNPLMEAILNQGLPYDSGPRWIAEHVLRGRAVIAVAGTHGKTTTTSILSWILDACGAAPGFLVGGVPGGFGVSARLGTGAAFVIEADEYDTAFFDKRSKFVHYRPRIAILNNLEYDHADIFPDLAAIETQFHHLVRTVPSSGRLIVDGSSEAIDRVLARGCWTPVERIGGEHADSSSNGADHKTPCQGRWQARVLNELAEATAIEVRLDGDVVGHCDLPLAGAQNRANLLAAVAAARALGIAPAAALEAAGRFPGVRRRLETRGTVARVTVIDDFAHHPTAIEQTINGLCARIHDGGRVLAVLEPRSNTMKLGTMSARLPASLARADRVFCYVKGLGWNVAQALEPLGDKAQTFEDLVALVAAVVAESRPGDRILVMSNGGFGGVHEKLLAALQDRAAAVP
jgi:UDP-N-acetylmuramate: L-alanyl-gamma-D-glutamyl-meso-diaminopimelate ligase